MATYETDFSEYSTGSPLSDWTERWNTGSFSNNVATNSWEYSLGGKWVNVTNSAGHKALSWDDIGSVDDVDVIALVYLDQGSANNMFGIFVRGSGTAGSEEAYEARFNCLSGTVGIYKYISGSDSLIGSSIGLDPVASNYYWVRFRVIGTALKLKVWSADLVEPSEWLIEETDSDISSSGWCGFGSYETNEYSVEYFKAVTGGGEVGIPSAFVGDIRFGTNVFSGGNTSLVNYARAMSGQVDASADGRSIVGCRFYLGNSHSDQVRLGLYRGGSLSSPVGATLLEDFGLTTGSDTQDWYEFSCDPIEISEDDILWLVIKGNNGTTSIAYVQNGGFAGDWQKDNGRWDSQALDPDETQAFEATWPAEVGGAFGAYWYEMQLLLDEESPPSTTTTTATSTSSTSSTTTEEEEEPINQFFIVT